MAIIFDNDNTSFPPLKRNETKKWIKRTIESFGKKTGDISYIFCSDNKILEINSKYLKHDYYTDIITFDYTENNKVSGDIYISLDTVKSNSEKFKTDYIEELHRVIIHGILHLCGINDKTSNEQEQMTNEENKALKNRQI